MKNNTHSFKNQLQQDNKTRIVMIQFDLGDLSVPSRFID